MLEALAYPLMQKALISMGAAVIAALITLRGSERMDVAVGMLWAGGMAFGILLLDLTAGYNVDLFSYLFGSILAIGNDVLRTMAVSVGVVLLIVTVFYPPLLAISVDRDFARSRGIPVGPMHVLLVATVALAVMIAVPAIGLILVIALSGAVIVASAVTSLAGVECGRFAVHQIRKRRVRRPSTAPVTDSQV